MKLFNSSVVLLILLSTSTLAAPVRQCDSLEIEFLKQQFQSSALSKANISDRQFSRDSLGTAEMCEYKNNVIADSISFTLYKPKGESSSFIMLHNGIDGSFNLYGPFTGNYT